MRKMILALVVVMLATPAWADITITVTDDGDLQASIGYSGTELARAFALDITVDAGTIDAVNGFAVGDDNGGYGIFPANFSRYITVDAGTGEVSDWAAAGYTPVAEAGDPGALGGLGTSGVTIELGSLYDTQAPALAGTLCVLTVSEACNMSVALNATRGNVVLEDASEATVVLPDPTLIGDTGPTYTGPYPAEWAAVGEPDCWIAELNPRQCNGDADGASQGKKKFWVSTNDLDVMIAAWNQSFADIDGQDFGGVPLICADFDQNPQGKKKFRVSTKDLDILIANWQQAGAPAGDCP
ncbi:MAG: hypothetical protein ACYSYV_06100 [Planctomycetota bacterium]|jgi:hypothetical protein